MGEFNWGSLFPFTNLSPKSGYNTAATGAEKAQGQYRDLANDTWNRSMGGMDKAMGYYNPAAGYAYGMSQMGPGMLESMAPNLYNQLNGPGQTGQAWSWTQGQLYKDPQSMGAYRDLQDFSRQPSAISGLQFNGPNAMGGAWNQSQNYWQTPGTSQGAYNQFSGQFSAPGTGEQWLQENQNQFRAPSSMSKLWTDNYGGYGEMSATEKALRDQYGQSNNKNDQLYAGQLAKIGALAGASATERAGNEVGGLYREAGGLARGANQAEQFTARQLPGLERQGMGEQFFASAMQGNNPYLQRIEDQNMARLNQEMARRGHFDSGGANAAIGNLLAASGAEKFKALNEMATGAQQLGQQRIGLGQGLAQSSDTGALARGQGIQSSGGSLQSLAGQQEGERMGREQLSQRIMENLFSQNNADKDFTLRSSQAADAAKLARLQGRDSLAAQNDRFNLDQLMAGGDFAFRGQDTAQNRALSGYNMGLQQDQFNLSKIMNQLQGGGMMDQSYRDDFNTRMNLANSQDQTGLARMMAMLSGAGQADQMNFQRLNQMMAGAGQYDQNTLDRTMGQFGIAGGAQGAERNRMMDAFNALFGVGGAQAGTTGQFYGMGLPLYYGGMEGGINAGANAAGLRGQGDMANKQFYMDFFKTMMGGGQGGGF